MTDEFESKCAWLDAEVAEEKGDFLKKVNQKVDVEVETDDELRSHGIRFHKKLRSSSSDSSESIAILLSLELLLLIDNGFFLIPLSILQVSLFFCSSFGS